MGGQQQSSLSAVFRLGRPAAWLLWCVKTARFATGKFGITFGTEPCNWVNTSVYPAIFSKSVTWRKCFLNFSTKEGEIQLDLFLKGGDVCIAKPHFPFIFLPTLYVFCFFFISGFASY